MIIIAKKQSWFLLFRTFFCAFATCPCVKFPGKRASRLPLIRPGKKYHNSVTPNHQKIGVGTTIRSKYSCTVPVQTVLDRTTAVQLQLYCTCIILLKRFLLLAILQNSKRLCCRFWSQKTCRNDWRCEQRKAKYTSNTRVTTDGKPMVRHDETDVRETH